jgi:hypothetical protein
MFVLRRARRRGFNSRRYLSPASILELKAVNVATETIEEVNLIHELTATPSETADPSGEEKTYHSMGRDPNLTRRVSHT